MESDWSTELVLEFINLYQKYPEIWDLKHCKHKNKLEVHDAWHKIKNELSVFQSIENLKKKKESLMTTYRALKRKVIQSIKSGAGREDVYTPTWFAFQPLDAFLGSVTGSINQTINTEDDTNMFEDYNELGAVEREKSQGPNTSNAAYKITKSPKSQMRKTNELDKELTRHMELASGALETLTKRRTNHQMDECSLYGELLASKLRALSLRNRKIVANKIDNLVFEAEMSEIDSSTSSSTSVDLQYPSQSSYNQNLKTFSKPSTSNSTSTKSSLSHSVSKSFPYRINPDNNSSLSSKQIIKIPSSSSQFRNFPIDRQSSFENNIIISNRSSPQSLTNSPYRISPQTIHDPASKSHSHNTDSRQSPLQQNNKTISKSSFSHSISNSVSHRNNPVSYSPLPSTQVIYIPVSNPHNINKQLPFNQEPFKNANSNPEESLNLSTDDYSYSPLPSPQLLFEEMKDHSQSENYETSNPTKDVQDKSLKEYFSSALPTDI